MQPQAAPAISCAATTISNVPENSITTMAMAPMSPNRPITGRPPQRLVIRLAGNIAMLKPTQNTGINVEMSLVNCLKRGALVEEEMQLEAKCENHGRQRENNDGNGAI